MQKARTTTAAGEARLVVIMADWCGHCQRMAPALLAAQEALAAAGDPPAALQCYNMGNETTYTGAEQEALWRLFGAYNERRAYPTIMKFNAASAAFEPFVGSRTADGFLAAARAA